MTSLTDDTGGLGTSGVSTSSLVDVWLSLANPVERGRRVRTLSIVKGRGLAHSNRTHEFEITHKGVVFKMPVAAHET
jgi:circadian clock protein KaiC